jgi:hypothetical protein
VEANALRTTSFARGSLDKTRLAIGVSILFAVVVLWIFFYRSRDWDVGIYHRYAQTCRETSLVEMYARHTVEYPPPAMLLILATDTIAQQLPDCSVLGRTFPEFRHPRSFANFKFVFRVEMALVTLACFLMLLFTLRSVRVWERCERLLIFIAALALLSHSAFDRLDMMLAMLVLASVLLLKSGRHYLWSYAVLSLAIAYKIVPIAIAPLWVVATLPQTNWRRLIPQAVGRTILLAGLTLLFIAPFFLVLGPRCLAFLNYHRERGLEYGSSYAALLAVLHHTIGLPTTTIGRFGSWDVESSLSPVLMVTAPLLTALLLVSVTVLGFVSQRQHGGRDWLGYVILGLLVFIFANKVFSPQYVLWLVPLVPLVPLEGRGRRLFHGGFLGLCLVTSWLNPRWMTEVVGRMSLTHATIYSGPTVFGTVLLATRTLLLMGLILGLGVALWQRCRKSIPIP